MGSIGNEIGSPLWFVEDWAVLGGDNRIPVRGLQWCNSIGNNCPCTRGGKRCKEGNMQREAVTG